MFSRGGPYFFPYLSCKSSLTSAVIDVILMRRTILSAGNRFLEDLVLICGKILKFLAVAAVLICPVFLPASGAGDALETEFSSLEEAIRNKDNKKVLTIIQKAADRKSPIALYMMSKIYYNGGFGKTTDRKDGYKYLEKAAKAGFRPAMLDLARREFDGRTPKDKQNERSAFKWCKDAKILHAFAVMLERLDAKEQKKLLKDKSNEMIVVQSYCVLRGRSVEGEPEDVVKSLEKLVKRSGAKPENGEAHYILARCYSDGIGVEPSAETAEKHMQKALDAGCPQAFYYVLSEGSQYTLPSGRRSRIRSGDDDENGAFAVFADVPQVYDFPTGKLATAYYLRLPSGKYVSLLKTQHIDAIKKLAEAGDIAMCALMYDICKYGIGTGTPNTQEAERWFEKRKLLSLMDRIVMFGGKMYASYKSSYHEFPDNRPDSAGGSGSSAGRRSSSGSYGASASSSGSSSAVASRPAGGQPIVEGIDVVSDEEWADPDETKKTGGGRKVSRTHL